MTPASDFQTNEKEDLDRKRVFFQRQYDESSGILLQIDNLLQESHDITLFTDWKRLKTDVQNLTEIDQTLQNPKRIESFNEDNFMKAVMEDIDKRLTRSIFKETETEIELLTNAVKEKEMLACELQKENNDLNKDLRQKQAEIEKLSQQFREWSMASTVCLFCAAIDIGTTYTRVAFSSRDDSKRQAPLISTMIWPGSKLLSFKAPTAVLLDSNQKFVAFGYEAENMYSELVAYKEHEEYYYFHRFKMLLCDRRITRDIKIKDVCDKEMEALTVFQSVIQFLKDQLLIKISEKIKVIEENDLFYVLTVPAVWEDSAKQFMREAATKAGIKSGHLSIALEPEAAAIYCQHFMTDRNNREKNAFAETIKAGMKYMVVDLGGGSADITVHQRCGDGTLKEVVPASGGPWGGKSIDESFHGFLKRIFGHTVMEELRKTELEDFNDLFRQFETKKRSIRVDQTNKVVVTLPVALIDLVKSCRGKMKTALEQSPYGQAVCYKKDKLHISPDTFRDLFKSTTEALIKHLERMFRDDKLSDLENLIMVGGFSECELIQHRMTEKFGKHKKIIIPKEAELAVLKGAVLYGNQPKAISAILMRRTYGIQSLWGPHMHPEYKKSDLVVVNRCKDLFFKFLQAGEKVEPGHTVSQIFQVFKSDESNLEFTIYTSIDPNPRYVTDPNCQRLGSLIIPLPDIRAGQTLEIEATMVVGYTELLVRAKDLHTGRIVECEFNLF
ncbi:heat shock 70 kDa protein 12A-like isoform X2 [Mytilus edulis]|uniref:heat shock 70 kDa protein 12A-like isoform X2 n=1 Tax=Mytilus edulis TaxID=6550 RepID=UPI0039F02F8D